MISKIHQVAARLAYPTETKAFYQNVLGVTFLAEFDPPGLLFFDCAGTRILFEASNSPATLYFWVDDFDDGLQRL